MKSVMKSVMNHGPTNGRIWKFRLNCCSGSGATVRPSSKSSKETFAFADVKRQRLRRHSQPHLPVEMEEL